MRKLGIPVQISIRINPELNSINECQFIINRDFKHLVQDIKTFQPAYFTFALENLIISRLLLLVYLKELAFVFVEILPEFHFFFLLLHQFQPYSLSYYLVFKSIRSAIPLLLLIIPIVIHNSTLPTPVYLSCLSTLILLS